MTEIVNTIPGMPRTAPLESDEPKPAIVEDPTDNIAVSLILKSMAQSVNHSLIMLK